MRIIGKFDSGPWECYVTPISRSDSLGGLRKGQKWVINHDFSEKPAKMGYWMGFWDPDLKEVCGITETQYGHLGKEARAMLDCKVQIMKYLPVQFYEVYARTHFPKEHKEWFAGGSSKEWSVNNARWERWLKQSEVTQLTKGVHEALASRFL